MSNSHINIELINKANVIAGKMIQSGISTSLALHAAKYATTPELSGSDQDKIFVLMNSWYLEKSADKKDDILLELFKLVVSRKEKNLEAV